MAQQREPAPPDVSDIIAAAVNGDATAPIGPPAPPSSGADYGTNNTGARQQSSAVLDLVIAKKGSPVKTENTSKPTVRNPTTGLDVPNPFPSYRYWWKDGSYLDIGGDPQGGHVIGGPALKALDTAAAGPKTTVSGGSTADKYIIQTDPATGQLTTVPNPNYVPSTSKTQQPKVLVSGSNPSDKTIIYFDPDTGEMTTKPNPNYADPSKLPLTPAQQAANALDTSRLGIEQQNANTASLSQQNAAHNTQLQAARDQVDAEYKRIASQVAQGQLTNEQGIARFKEVVDQFQAQRDALTTAMTAGDNAARYAEMATRNAVGPGFGANFARGLQGVSSADPSKVSYGSGDFTYQTPDYQGIAAKATAAALAHLSPFAAQLAAQHQANQGAVGNVAGYRPQPAPDVIGQAAASVVGQQPGYRPAGVSGPS